MKPQVQQQINEIKTQPWKSLATLLANTLGMFLIIGTLIITYNAIITCHYNPQYDNYGLNMTNTPPDLKQDQTRLYYVLYAQKHQGLNGVKSLTCSLFNNK